MNTNETEHDYFCNCEDCFFTRGEKEICSICGCIIGQGCPCDNENKEINNR